MGQAFEARQGLAGDGIPRPDCLIRAAAHQPRADHPKAPHLPNMPGVSVQELSRFQTPASDGAVGSPGVDCIGAEGDAEDGFGVADNIPRHLPRRRVPQPHRAILVAHCQGAIRVAGETSHPRFRRACRGATWEEAALGLQPTREGREHRELLARVHPPRPDRPVVAPAADELASARRYAPHGASMSR